ncbi:YciI family protein [Marinilabilia rubra]|uniref:YCII-related domain-containing protein n=1 Tax=Marinilabilia rubra TaxID=2162893 RepID=A0A2U2B9J6_9BACT|nr:YciI family protein [Marinilabilia rubra]PWD99706.1 hypothetical protein DDZ16_09690 [Marinilabilia rubra]
MFIILIHFRKSDSQIDYYNEDHKQFLKENIAEGNFITAGMRSPKTGEAILSCIDDLESLQIILSEDPFYKQRIGQYEIIEFTPDMTCNQMQEYMDTHDENC